MGRLLGRQRALGIPTLLAAAMAMATFAPAASGETLDNQICCGEFAILSQEFAASSTGNTEVADDFTVPPGQTWSIDEVLSVWLAQGAVFMHLPGVNVAIYADTGSGAPGGPIYTRLELPILPHVLDEGAEIFEYQVPLTGVPVLGPGRYWLSLQVDGSKTTYGTWFWGDVTSQQGAAAMLRNPGDEFETGCTNWKRRTTCILEGSAEPDQSFILGGAKTVAVPPLPPAPAATPPPKPKVIIDGSPKPGAGGTKILSVKVSGPGVVSATGKGLKSVKAHAPKSGAVKLRLKLNGVGRKALRRSKSGRLKVKVKITFAPRSGRPKTVAKLVTFARKKDLGARLARVEPALLSRALLRR